MQLRVDHPQHGRRFAVKVWVIPDEHCDVYIFYKVQSDFVHDNNVVRSKLYFGYSVRSSETKYIETEVSYDKLAQTFIAVTTDGRNIYEAQVNVSFD